jgi:hypothetical protein
MHFGMRIVALVLVLAAPPACAAERLAAFHGDVRIQRDGWISVTETIEVEARGKRLRRGIVRELPAEFRNVLHVTRNGQPEPFELERFENGARLRIDAGGALPNGKHVYSIAYRAEPQMAFYGRRAELRWTVTGNGWTLPFNDFTAEVTLPERVPAERIEVAAHTGAAGALGQDYNAFVRQGSAAFRVTRALKPGEEMTIFVAFPRGLVAERTRAERIDRYLSDNLALGALLLALAAALAIAFPWYWVEGRPRMA